MTDNLDFVAIAKKQIYEPNSPDNFLPTHYGIVRMGPGFTRHGCFQNGWIAPSYATFGDIPVVGEFLTASLMVRNYRLDELVILPPNMKGVFEAATLTEHQEKYISQYKDAAAIIDFIIRTRQFNDAMMLHAFENWKETCDNLLKNPHFGIGWELPAYFPVYSAFCSAAIEEFFAKKKELHPCPCCSAFFDRQYRHAIELHLVWEDMFVRYTSPLCVPFTKCLWYHKFHVVHELRQPEVWIDYFSEDFTRVAPELLNIIE
jgi:hypothetical protein